MTAPAPPKAVPTIGLRVEGDEVAPETFLDAARCLLDILSEVGRSISGGKTLEWRLSDLTLGSAGLAVQPKSGEDDPEAARAISRTVSGFSEMAETARRPAHFTDRALRGARKLGALADATPGRVQVSSINGATDAQTCSLTRDLASRASEVMRPPLAEIGSVEGTLEAVSIHGRVAFAVYNALTGDRVECCCDRETLDRAATHLGKRVIVTGEIHYRADGEPRSLQVESFELLGEGPFPQTEDVRGLYADDPISMEEWARYVREK